jgi:Glycoside hydrolase family 44
MISRPATGLLSTLLALCFVSCGGGGYNSSSGGGGGTAPAAPAGLAAVAGNQQISLTWDASAGATSYHVKRAAVSGGPYIEIAGTFTNSIIDKALTNGTTYYYVVSALNSYGESANSSVVSATPTGPSVSVHVTVDVLTNRHSISPYVYGGAFPKDGPTITDSNLTTVRWGGNASTRYNWINFDTNAAADYYFINRPMGNAPLYQDSTQFVSNVAAAGGSPLVTVGMLPWVAKDATGYSFSVAKYGAQCKVDPFNSDHGNGVKPDCNTNVTGNDPHDADFPLLDGPPQAGDPAGSVYRNQWVTALAKAFGTAPHFYNMDNEIDIWNGTHRDVHPNPATYNELRDTYLTEARALKGWDPAAIRLGPVSCCWYFYWRSATGASDTSSHGGVDFLPWWLNEIAWSDSAAATRSLDIFDIHAYPDGPDTTSFTQAQKQALAVRIYRDWWDPTYTSEAPYIVGGGFSIEPMDSKPFRIPRMRAVLNTIYPGTQFSITEWSAETAGAADFSTALGDADAYGILGRERVYLASRWTAPDPANPNYQILKLYRNYDGNHNTFAPISVSDTNDGSANLFSSYAAVNSAGTTMTVMVLNKDPQNTAQTQFTFNGFVPTSVTAYTVSQTSPNSIVASSSRPWPSSGLSFAPYSATLLVINGATAKVPGAEWDLNPDAIMVPAGGTTTLQPKITTGSAAVTLTSVQADSGITAILTQPNLTTSQTGTITVAAAGGAAPGFYHYTVVGTDSTGVIQNQGGWIIVGKPAATLAKTGDNQTGAKGSMLNLSVALSPGQSGGTSTGATVFFTTDGGSLSSRIVTTDSSGNAGVVLTLPGTAGTVHVTAEGPYGLGHPVATFTETAQ